MGRDPVKNREREKALNRARVAKHTRRKKERQAELLKVLEDMEKALEDFTEHHNCSAKYCPIQEAALDVLAKARGEDAMGELLVAAESFMAAYRSNVIDIDIRIRLEDAIAKARGRQ